MAPSLRKADPSTALRFPPHSKTPPARACPRLLWTAPADAPSATALSLHSTTRFQLTCFLNVKPKRRGASLPAALQTPPGSRMPATTLDCAGRASASTALSLHSAIRSQLTGLLNVSQSGVALSLPAALQNAPRLAHARGPFWTAPAERQRRRRFHFIPHPLPADWSPRCKPKRRGAFASRRTPKHPRLAHAHDPLDCAGRAPASTALSLPSATRSQLTGLLVVSQSGVALSLPAALQNTPGSRMPTTALDCAGRASASTALSLHSATRSQLTCLLNVSQSGVALRFPPHSKTPPGSRMPTTALDCAGRAPASTALSLLRNSTPRFVSST